MIEDVADKGGRIELVRDRECLRCKHAWTAPIEFSKGYTRSLSGERAVECPACGSPEVAAAPARLAKCDAHVIAHSIGLIDRMLELRAKQVETLLELRAALTGPLMYTGASGPWGEGQCRRNAWCKRPSEHVGPCLPRNARI